MFVKMIVNYDDGAAYEITNASTSDSLLPPGKSPFRSAVLEMGEINWGMAHRAVKDSFAVEMPTVMMKDVPSEMLAQLREVFPLASDTVEMAGAGVSAVGISLVVGDGEAETKQEIQFSKADYFAFTMWLDVLIFKVQSVAKEVETKAAA